MPDGRIYHGHEGVREFWRDWTGTWDDFDFELEEAVDAGDDVLVRVRQVGKGRESGAPVALSFGQIWTLRGGKVIRFRAFPTFEEALEAAGLRE